MDSFTSPATRMFMPPPSFAALLPANAPVEKAICKLKPPVVPSHVEHLPGKVQPRQAP